MREREGIYLETNRLSLRRLTTNLSRGALVGLLINFFLPAFYYALVRSSAKSLSDCEDTASINGGCASQDGKLQCTFAEDSGRAVYGLLFSLCVQIPTFIFVSVIDGCFSYRFKPIYNCINGLEIEEDEHVVQNFIALAPSQSLWGRGVNALRNSGVLRACSRSLIYTFTATAALNLAWSFTAELACVKTTPIQCRDETEVHLDTISESCIVNTFAGFSSAEGVLFFVLFLALLLPRLTQCLSNSSTANDEGRAALLV